MKRDRDGIEKLAIQQILSLSVGDMLEVGCGDGRLTEDLIDLSGTLFAMDPDPVTIIEAKKRLDGEVRFIIGSGEDLPLPCARFDTVVFSLSLHHQNPVLALAEARRIIREGGRILILEPAPESLYNRLFRIIHDEDEAYARVDAAVRWCDLRMVDSGSFTTRWEFEDFGEMVNHMFSYCDLPPDQPRVRAMEDLLEDGKTTQPLIINDTTNFWMLQGDSPS